MTACPEQRTSPYHCENEGQPDSASPFQTPPPGAVDISTGVCILIVEERHVDASCGLKIPTAFSLANFGPKKHQRLREMTVVVGKDEYKI